MQQSIEYNKGQADSLWQWVPASEFRLPETILNTLLPMPAGQLSQIITELNAAELIKAIENRWRLPPLGYPVAREFLAGEGYLLDDF